MKKLLIYLSLLFNISLFLFIPGFKVKAATSYSTIQEYDFDNLSFSYNSIDYNKEIIYSKIEDYFNNNRTDKLSDYKYIFIGVTSSKSTSTSDTFGYIYIDLFSEDLENVNVFSASAAAWASWYIEYDVEKCVHLRILYSTGEIQIENSWSRWITAMMTGTKSRYTNVYTNFNLNTSMLVNTSQYSDYMQIYIDNEMYNSFLTPQSYNVTFHLNGGIVYDNNYITDDKGSYIIGNKYEDYTTMIQTNNLREYLQNQDVKKESMDFKGWYYDEKLTLKVDPNDVLTGDTNLYAKFLYTDVEDFLKNTTFNTYTFDTDYEYAIISLNSKTNKDIYLGLNYIDYSLEIYKYLKNDNEYKQGSVKCLIPYYSKDNKYYYWLESPLDNDYEVLILPKGKFKDNNYEFLLSNNAYVSYTNDLTKVIIKNDNGQDIETNLENSYNYSQDSLINNENNIIEIFKKLSENKNNNVFSYFNQIWNYIKRSKLYTYLLTLIIGSLIILIIHVAKR